MSKLRHGKGFGSAVQDGTVEKWHTPLSAMFHGGRMCCSTCLWPVTGDEPARRTPATPLAPAEIPWRERPATPAPKPSQRRHGASARLAVVESWPTQKYMSFIGSDEGQTLLERCATEADASRMNPKEYLN